MKNRTQWHKEGDMAPMDLSVRGCLKENATSIYTSYKLQSRRGSE